MVRRPLRGAEAKRQRFFASFTEKNSRQLLFCFVERRNTFPVLIIFFTVNDWNRSLEQDDLPPEIETVVSGQIEYTTGHQHQRGKGTVYLDTETGTCPGAQSVPQSNLSTAMTNIYHILYLSLRRTG